MLLPCSYTTKYDYTPLHYTTLHYAPARLGVDALPGHDAGLEAVEDLQRGEARPADELREEVHLHVQPLDVQAVQPLQPSPPKRSQESGVRTVDCFVH